MYYLLLKPFSIYYYYYYYYYYYVPAPPLLLLPLPLPLPLPKYVLSRTQIVVQLLLPKSSSVTTSTIVSKP